MKDESMIAQAILTMLQSLNVSDSNGEVANVVDVIHDLAVAARRISTAITAPASPGTDATGGSVDSLTEAVMGITAGLVRIADAISGLADAVREGHQAGSAG